MTNLCVREYSGVLAKTGADTALVLNGVCRVFPAGAIITITLTPVSLNAAPESVGLLCRIVMGRFFLGQSGAIRGTGEGTLRSPHHRRLRGCRKKPSAGSCHWRHSLTAR